MKIIFSAAIVGILIAASCSRSEVEILAICEELNADSVIIKWETLPNIVGQVHIYTSASRESVRQLMATANVERGQVVLPIPQFPRPHFYTLVLDDQKELTVSTRRIYVKGVDNFRDIGGYLTSDKKEIEWGMVYRSDCLDSIENTQATLIEQLGIKTVIDLRALNEIEQSKIVPLSSQIQVFNTPLYSARLDSYYRRIHDEKVTLDSLRHIVLDMHIEFVENHTESFYQIFEILQNPNVYPVLLSCKSGKMRVGFLTALLLKMLGVDQETIVADYTLSDQYCRLPQVSLFGEALSEESQEIITAFYSSQPQYMDDIFDYLNTRYGGVFEYLQTRVGLSAHEIAHLRALLVRHS